MKNSEIHKGLSKELIRNFLAMSMVESYSKDNLNQLEPIVLGDSNDAFEYAIARAKAEIKYLEKSLENLMVKQALVKIVKLNGWDEHDVSDHTNNDTGHSLWMNFIGTEAEYNKLMIKINKDK